MRGFLYFQRKDKAKRFPESSSSLPQMHPPRPRWCVAEIPSMIVSRVPQRSNSTGDISLQVWWLCECYYPMSAHSLSDNQYWTRRTQCNPWDNATCAHPKSVTRAELFFVLKILWAKISVLFWTVWYNIRILDPGVLANQNKYQLLRTYIMIRRSQCTKAVRRQESPVWGS